MYKYEQVCTIMSTKSRLTVTVDQDILEEAKKITKEKRLPLSGIIENFLEYLIDPYVYCFNCGKKFHSKETDTCPKCTMMICPGCNTCSCDLDETTSQAIYQMKKVYEDLLKGRVNE